MNYDKEAIDTLRALQKKFKEEGLESFRLSSNNIVKDIAQLATRSPNLATRKLALKALKQIEFDEEFIQLDDRVISLTELVADKNPAEKDSLESENSITYRGQKVKTQTSSEKGIKKSKRTYRGQTIG